MKKNNAKGRLLDSRVVIFIFALLVAFLGWMIVAGFIMPNEEYDINNVPINYLTGNANYKNRDLDIVGDMPATVRVTVTGDGGTITTLTNADVSVYCDYSGVTSAGIYEIPLKADNIASGNYEVAEIYPKTITLQFEKVHRTTLTIGVVSDGITAAPGYYKDEPVLSTLQVEVTGPDSEMEAVASAVVIIPDDAVRNSTYTYSDAEVVLLDADGNTVEKGELITVSPSEINVEIPFLPITELPVTLGVSGAPQSFDEEWFLGLITLSNETIRVAGDAATLEMHTELRVGAIDVSTFDMDKEYDFAVTLPEGLVNLDGIQLVSTIIDTSDLAMRTIEVPLEQVSIVSVPTGVQCEVLNPAGTRTVTLVGPQEELDELIADNVTIEVDASGLSLDNGRQQNLGARVYVPRSGRIFATGNYAVLCSVGMSDE